jgi:hypothetical protein
MTTVSAPGLTAVALSCSLKPSPAPSSSELLATQILDQLAKEGVAGESFVAWTTTSSQV